jgi:hypothetical protein
MLFLVLRLLCAPLSVLLGTAAQRRFGHAVGGLIIGLPLLFLPFLWLIGHEYGVGFARAMTASLLIASSAEVALLWTFAYLAPRTTATWSLLGSVGAFALVAALLRTTHVGLVLGSALAVLSLALALVLWPRSTPGAHSAGKPRLLLRLAASTGFTVVLISFAGHLGANLSGILDAIPLTSLMMAFFTRRESSAEGSSAFLRGVTRGSISYVVSMFVLVELWRAGNELTVFAVSLVAALVTQLAVQSSGPLLEAWRAFDAERLSLHVHRRVPGASTFKKFYESIAA